MNKKLTMFQTHKELSKLNSNRTQMDYDANNLYHSAMWDENSVYPKIEAGFAFKPEMNNVYVEAFNHKTFNQDGDESAILTINYHNPPNLIVQQLPVKEKSESYEKWLNH